MLRPAVASCGGVTFYGLIPIIEIERHRKGKPPKPDWLRKSYHDAWLNVL